VSLIAFLKGAGPNGFGYGSTAEEVTRGIDLSGKTFLLTGCNSGLGLETLRVLSLRGGYVIATARTEQKARAAITEVAAAAVPLPCDLAEPDTIRACVARVKQLGRPIDAVICNAGIMALPRLRQRFGYELQFLVNHIGHFMLVTQLVDVLAEAGRVVVVSSNAHKRAHEEGIQLDNLSGKRGYSPWAAYGQSKLANLLFARQLAGRLAGSNRTANALHPGVIRTKLGRHMNPLARAALAAVGPLFLKTVQQGAATQCFLAAHPDVAAVSGRYYADCNPAPTSSRGADDDLAKRLWQVSERIVEQVS
jgi:WW domain-containing oxidoreductase